MPRIQMDPQVSDLGSPSRHTNGCEDRRPCRLALVVLLSLLTTGCFSHVPLENLTPGRGDRVRAHLTSETAREISRRVGHPITTIEGRILFADVDSLRISAGWRGLYAGTPFEPRRDTLAFATGEILHLERRELSRSRSAVVALGIAALIVAMFQWLDLGGSTEGTPVPGPPEV